MDVAWRPTQRGKIPPAFFVAVLILLIILFVAYRRLQPMVVEVAIAQRSQLQATLTATGFVEAVQSPIAPKTPGRVVRILVDENDTVKCGQLLATLDSEVSEAQVRVSGAASELAAAQAQEAGHSVAVMTIQAPGAIGQAQAALDAARAQLKQLETGARPEEKAVAVAQTDRARAALDTAGIQLQRANTALVEQRVASEASIREAESLLNAARAREKQVLVGPRPQEIARAEAALVEARARALQADNDLKRARQLFEGGATARQQVEVAETSLTAARSAEASAREYRDLLRSGSRREEIEVARAEVQAAEARLQRARTSEHEVSLRQREVEAARAEVQAAEAALRAASEQAKLVQAGARSEEVEQAGARMREAVAALRQATSWNEQVRVRESGRRAAQAGLKQARATAQAARAQFNETRLYAPFDGVLARRYVDPGAVVFQNTPAFLLVDLKRKWVAAEIDAEDIGKLKVGQVVDVTAEGYPGKSFPGRLREIAPVAEPKPGGRTRARIVRAKVDLLNEAPELKPGMEVDVRTRSTIKPGALLLPTDAVLEENDHNFVYVVEGASNTAIGTVHKRRVKTGSQSEVKTEILQGLTEGDRVVLVGKEAVREGLRVRIEQK